MPSSQLTLKFSALVKKEFLVLTKDWHGLMVLFLMPAAFILIMSMAMENAFGEQKSISISYAVLNQSQAPLPPELLNKIKTIPGFTMVELPTHSIDDAKASIIEKKLQLVVVIPADFRQRLTATALDKESALPDAINLLLAPGVKPYVQQLFNASLSAILIRQKIDWMLNSNPNPAAPPAVTQSTLDQLSQLNLGEQYIYSGTAEKLITPNAVQQNVPAWLVFAMFFVAIPLSTVFLIEKQQGTLLRLRVMNVSAPTILAGKFLPYYCVNQVQMVVMIAIGITIVPLLGGQQLSLPHSIVGLIIISSACSLAAIGFALMIATLVKTTMQATTIGGVVNIIFGALGGIMVPKFIMPETMQALTYLSPMSWGLEGFLDLFLRQSGWQEVLPEALYLSAFGLLCITIAAYRFNKTF